MSATALPTAKQSRDTQGITPLNARVMLAGMPKAGKTTLAGQWAPDTTLIIDTQHGTDLLDGEHYVQHVTDWDGFVSTVDLLVAGGHPFKTVVIDLIDDVWKFADMYAADKKNVAAAALVEYGKGTEEAEGLFRRQVGRLLASTLGLWFITHTETEENDKVTRYVPKLHKRVKSYVEGAVQFIFLAETLGAKRVLHTQPTAKFGAGSRVPLPDPMDLDARQLYGLMGLGLGTIKPKDAAPAETVTSTTEQDTTDETTATQEPVAA
jgi:hypothetical protein